MLFRRIIYSSIVLIAIYSCTEAVEPEILEAKLEIVTPQANNGYVAEILRPVKFINRSTSALKYNWDFGDGESSALESPVHIYKKNGRYTVKLTAFANTDSSTVEVVLRVGFRSATEILLEKINFFDPSGAPWDYLGGPELIVMLYEKDVLEEALILTTKDNISFSDLPFGGGFYNDKVIGFKSNSWIITLLENNEPFDLIDQNDRLMFTSTFNPLIGGGKNLEEKRGKIIISKGQNESGEITEEFIVSILWKLRIF